MLVLCGTRDRHVLGPTISIVYSYASLPVYGFSCHFPLDAEVDEVVDGSVEVVAQGLGREQLELLHDVDAPAGLEIRRVEVAHGRIDGVSVGGLGGGVEVGEAADDAVPEVARVGLGGGGLAGGGEEAVAVGVDLPGVVKAEDEGRERERGGGLPGDAALPDPVEAAAQQQQR